MLSQKLNKTVYTDIDVDFVRHPTTLDAITSNNVMAVKNSLINLIMTRKGERIHQPEIGSNIHQLLFELPSPPIESMIKQLIEELIHHQEQRIKSPNVIITSKDTSYIVTIEFTLSGASNINTIEFELGTQ
jgi:phage baseplate assembly protein W